VQSGSLVLIFEDLHWIDPTSYEIIHEIITFRKDVPLLIIVLLRPELEFYNQYKEFLKEIDSIDNLIDVRVLDDTSSLVLVEKILNLKENTLSTEIVDLILSKAEGNPFYIEEFVKSLIDKSILIKRNEEWELSENYNEIEIPTTLAGVLSARLDSLDKEDKHVVQSASVIGREFPVSTLKGIFEHPIVLDSSLLGLEKRNLILKSPVLVPENQYFFKHLLTQEAAYNSLLNRRRKEIHTNIAEYYEFKGIDQEEFIENKIAHHFLKAKEDKRALPYLIEAGRKSSHMFAIEEAENTFNLALKIAENTDNDDLLIKTYIGSGNLFTITDRTGKAIEVYQKMYELAKKKKDMKIQVSALNKLSYVNLLIDGNLEEADKYRKMAVELKSDDFIIDELAETELIHCYINVQKYEDPENLEKKYAWAADIGKDIGKNQAVLLSNTHRTTSLLMSGRLDDAFELANETIKISKQNGDKQYLSNIYSVILPLFHYYRGNFEEANEALSKGIKMSEAVFNYFGKSFALYTRTLMDIKTGYFENALKNVNESLELSKTFLENNGFSSLNYALNALVTHIIYGKNKRSDVEEMIQLALKTKDLVVGDLFLSNLYDCLISIYYDYEEYQKISVCLNEVVKKQSFDFALLRSNFNLVRAKLAIHNNDYTSASKLIREARNHAESLQLSVLYPEIFLLQGKVELLKENKEEGLNLINTALDMAKEMKLDYLQNDIYFELSSFYKENKTYNSELKKLQERISNRFNDEEIRDLIKENLTLNRFYS
jgi:tetratricopeptide (TPR) repeat protein